MIGVAEIDVEDVIETLAHLYVILCACITLGRYVYVCMYVCISCMYVCSMYCMYVSHKDAEVRYNVVVCKNAIVHTYSGNKQYMYVCTKYVCIL